MDNPESRPDPSWGTPSANMFTFVLRRIIQSIPVLIGIVLICFALFKLSGDPLRILAGERTPEYVREEIRKRFHLNDPYHEQLWFFTKGLFTGELESYRHGRPVNEMVLEGAAVTMRLALGAIIIAVALGLAAGLLSAHKPHSTVDYAAAAGASIGVSVPAFWLAMILILIFSVRLEWLPLGGYRPGQIEYLVIPVATLGLICTALIARLSRNCLLEAVTQDCVRTARAKGRSRLQVLLGHAFPNALVPILTVIGTNLASLMTGAVLTETTCAVPGLGRVIFQAITERDHPVILSGCLFFAFVFVFVNLVVDVLYGFLDPRIRHHA
jgi:peptide/nickel transport system permease protein